jgi:DNA invertase Pin-like site-specific DNA recombinase
LEKAGVDFVVADMSHANRLTVGVMAMVADEERRMISQRTKAALAAAKKRGVKLGGDRGVRLSRAARKAGRDAQAARADERAADLAHVICDLRRVGITSLSGIAKALTERRIPTPRGGGEWTATQVARTVARIEATDSDLSTSGDSGQSDPRPSSLQLAWR